MNNFSTENQMFNTDETRKDALPLTWALNIIANRGVDYGEAAWRDRYGDLDTENKFGWEEGYNAAMRDVLDILQASRFGLLHALENMPSYDAERAMLPPEAFEVIVTVNPSCISMSREEGYIQDIQNRFRKWGTESLYDNEQVTRVDGNKVYITLNR